MSNMDDHIGPFLEELRRIRDLAHRGNYSFPFMWENPIAKVDIIRWLAGTGADSKCYWKSRDGQFELGGVGAGYSISFDTERSLSSRAVDIMRAHPDSDLIFFKARRFYDRPRRDEIWKNFPDRLCFIPERMIVRRGTNYKTYGCLHVPPDADIMELASALERIQGRPVDFPSSTPKFNIGSPVSRKHFPDYNLWQKNIELSLKAISSGEIEKIVMARRTDYSFEKEIDPPALLAALAHGNPLCFAVLYQPCPGTAFISFTPERLYRRIDKELEVDAMSSTVPRGATVQEDRQLAGKLFSDRKLRREQLLVVGDNSESIEHLVVGGVRAGPTSVYKLERVQHLITPIEGILRDGVTDADIIKALHPTPAVGGTPRRKAIPMIEIMEPFDRGWYASPIGYISEGQSEFAVGIRSMLVTGKTVSVFTGAGIVAGSDPETEWREIESKDILRPILNGVTAQ